MNEILFDAKKIDLKNLPMTDCHLHTSWTDGKASVNEVYDAAVTRGLKAILYSEHSRKTSVDWFCKFADEVRRLPDFPCKAYVGTEVKVETIGGDIDTIAEISNQCDFVMASVHRFVDEGNVTIQFNDTDPDQAVDIEYSLTWAVLSNPCVDILGHMFGMSYRRFGKVPPDSMIRQLIKRASEFGVAVEVNSYYHPNALQMIKWCQEFDVKIAFGSNAHTLIEVGSIMQKIQLELSNA